MTAYLKKGPKEYALFDLYAIVQHQGSLHGGHYIAYIRNLETDEWFEFNDDDVRKRSWAEVSQIEAYLLFYGKGKRKEDPSRHLDDHPPGDLGGNEWISRRWYHRLRHFAEPGPLSLHELMCHHGGMLIVVKQNST